MRKSICITIVILLLSVICANAEDLYDFINFPRPFVTSKISFSDITVEMTQNYLNSLPGFICKRTNFTDRRIRIECNSDKKAYKGTYKLIFSYGKDGKIQFVNIYAAHPELDKILSSSSYDLKYWAKVLWKKVISFDYMKNAEPILYAEGYSDHVFSSEISGIVNCNKIDDSCVLCVAYKDKERPSDSNKYVLSISNTAFFATQ